MKYLVLRRGGFQEILNRMIHSKRTRPKSWLLVVFASLLLSFFVSCKEDNPPEPPVPSMTILEAPSFLAANVDSCYMYRVQLENVQSDSVLVFVYAPDGAQNSTFALYDDGGSLPSMPPTYACSNSGDIVPSNGQFTRRINAQALAIGVTGAYQFLFHAHGVAEQRLTVHIENVSACLITQWPQDNTFDACFATSVFDVHVSRAAEDIVDSVRVLLCDPSQSCPELAAFHPIGGDTVWRLTMSPRLFRCGQHGDAGYYSFTYEAVTRYGQTCQQSVSIGYLANELPVLSDLMMPDTIYRPIGQGAIDTLLVTIRLTDCELAGDTSFAGLRFDRSRDDTLHWGTDVRFVLVDNGHSGDVTAGDQIYSAGFLIPNGGDTLVNNIYNFRFYAVEGLIAGSAGEPLPCNAIGDTSAYLYKSVRLIQPPGLMSDHTSVVHSTGAGIRVFN